MNYFALSAAALACLLLAQCKTHDPDPAEQLPPATQTGANTFGCLLNGEVFVPSKGDITRSTYSVSLDPGYRQGTLGVSALRSLGTNKGFQSIGFAMDSMNHTGTYPFRNGPGNQVLSFVDDSRAGLCQSTRLRGGAWVRGQLVVTRLDYQAGIVAGTFAFTLAQPGCDTIRVTKGRFDYHL